MANISSRILAIAIPLLLALSSCGGGESNNGAEANVTENNFGAAIPSVADEPAPVPPPPPERVALHEAARRGLITYEVTGNGSSSGASLELRVRRHTPEPLTLYVAPGTVFGSRSSRVQRMVARALADAPEIQLADNEYQDLTVEAYCLDIELDNPSADNVFTAGSIDARAAAILREAESQGLEMEAIQAAIWMDEGATDQAIASVFPASPAHLAAARALLERLPRRS